MYFYFIQLVVPPFEDLANQIKSSCNSAKYRPTCYDKELSLLMYAPYKLSMNDTFKVSRIISQNDEEYGFCHVLGHKLASQETKKDPSKWKDVIAQCPSGTCSNGCIHGAFQEKFRYEYLSPEQISKIKPELRSICQKREGWNPSGIEQGSCYHALGHLLMYVSNADISSSVALCHEMAITDAGTSFSSVCLDGVFMQMFQPLETEDFSLIRGKVPNKDQVLTFCNQFDDEARASCWNESWPLQGKSIRNAVVVSHFCSQLNGQYKDRCYTAMFYIMPVQFNLDLDKSFNFCQGFSAEYKGKCFAQVAQRLVQTDQDFIDKAISFCKKTIEFDAAELCFAELASKNSFNFAPGSAKSMELCTKLPDKWKPLCTR